MQASSLFLLLAVILGYAAGSPAPKPDPKPQFPGLLPTGYFGTGGYGGGYGGGYAQPAPYGAPRPYGGYAGYGGYWDSVCGYWIPMDLDALWIWISDFSCVVVMRTKI